MNTTPLTQIVYLSNGQCTPQFKKDLNLIAKMLGIEATILQGEGVMHPDYQRAFREFYDTQNGSHLSEENSSDKDEHKTDKDTKSNGDHDECVSWLTSVIKQRKHKIDSGTAPRPDHLKGLRKKGPRRDTLSSKPKVGSHRKAKDFFLLQDRQVRGSKDLLLRNNLPTEGGAMKTRSRTKDQDTLQSDDSFLELPQLPKRKRRKVDKKAQGDVQMDQPFVNGDRPTTSDRTEQTATDNQPSTDNSNNVATNRTNDQSNDQADGQLNDDRTDTLRLQRGCAIVIDDAFLSDHKRNTDNTSSAAKSEFLLQTLKHLNLLSEAASHHCGLSFLLVSQSPTIVTGTSILASYVRRIRQNIDVFINFKTDSNTARHFLNTVSSGETYQRIKAMMSEATNPPSCSAIDPRDQRGCFPAFVFTLNNQSCNPNLQYR